MAIKRFAGAVVQMPVPFTVSTSDPLDERLVIEKFDDIKDINTFKNTATGSKVYEGMQVYAIKEKAVYMYVGPYVEGDGVTNAAATTQSNWRKLSTSGTSADVIENYELTIDNILKQLGTESGDTAITEYHEGDTYISGANSVNSALTLLNNAIEELSADSINFEEIVGVDRHSSSLSGLTGSTLSGLSDPTVLKALNELDKNIKDDDDAIGAEGDSSIKNYVSGATYINNDETVVDALNTLDGQVKNNADAIGAEGDSNIENYVSGNTYTSGSTTIIEAIEKLDDALDDNSEYISNLEKVIGVTKDDVTMTGLTGYCLSSITEPTVQKALNKLDDVIIENELVTMQAVDALATAAGFEKDPIVYSVDETAKYIGTSTTIKQALKQLNDAIENHKMLTNVEAPLLYQDASETLSLVLDNEIHDGGSDDTCYNVISASTKGLYALADLHYDDLTNKLTWINTRGEREIQLTGINFIDGAYVTSAETLVIEYTKQDGSEGEVEIDLTNLIKENEYQKSNDPASTKTEAQIKAEHNVSLYREAIVDGQSKIYGDIEIFDCGEY